MKRIALNKIVLLFLFVSFICGAAAAQTKVTNNLTDDCGCEATALPEVLAVVNGIKITKTDFSAKTVQKISELRQAIVDARKAELDLIINSRLLDAESKKLGTTTTKLLEQEVIAKTKEPTEAEALAFYDQNKERIKSDFKTVRNDVIAYLREQRNREAAKSYADRLRAASIINKIVEAATPPASPADRSRILAYVNSQPIRSSDVEDNLQSLISSFQKQAYQLRRDEIDLKINDILLEQEAQKRKITTRALLDSELAGKATNITEADAQAFYNQNKERINGEFAETKQQIIQYLAEQENIKTQKAFAARLRSGASIQVFLPAAP